MTTIMQKQSESLHARIPHDTLEEIDQIAANTGRSRNWVFNEAIKQYIDVQRWQIQVIKQRMKESESSKAKFIVHDKVMEKYEKRLKAKLKI